MNSSLASITERVVAGLPGLLMLMNGISFLVDPTRAADGLGMPLLDDMGRSTQIGDFAAFFVATSIFIFIGAVRRSPAWLCAGALILALAATFRVFAFAFHGAPFAAAFIAIEVVMAVWLVGFAWWFRRPGSPR